MEIRLVKSIRPRIQHLLWHEGEGYMYFVLHCAWRHIELRHELFDVYLSPGMVATFTIPIIEDVDNDWDFGLSLQTSGAGPLTCRFI